MNKYLVKLKKDIFLLLVFSILWTLTNIFLPYLNIILFNHVNNLTIKLITFLGLAFFTLIALNSLFQYTYQSMEWKTSAKFKMLLQSDLFKRIISSSQNNFRQLAESEYLSLFNNDVNVMEEEYLSPIIDIIRSVLELIFYTIALVLFIDWRLAILVVLSSLVGVGVPKLVAEKLSNYRKNQLEKYAVYFKSLSEILKSKYLVNSITLFQFTKRHNHFSQQAQGSLYDYGKFKTLSNVLNGFAMFIVSFVSFITISIFLYKRTITVGAAVATFSYIENFIYPIRYILTDINALHASKKTKRLIEKWLENPESVVDKQKEKSFSSLSLVNVSLCNGDKKIFKNVTIQINKGEKTAFIGPNGYGKSSLIEVIAQIKPIQQGSILFNDFNKEDKDLSQIIFFSPQDPIIFSDTLENNITLFGSYPLKKNLIIETLALLNLNLNDLVNPAILSGGERQLIGFMRVLNSEKDFLILDEPFSSVSKELEEKLTRILMNHQNSTILMVTHNVQKKYLSHFKRIWLVKDLNIVDRTTDEEILEIFKN